MITAIYDKRWILVIFVGLLLNRMAWLYFVEPTQITINTLSREISTLADDIKQGVKRQPAEMVSDYSQVNNFVQNSSLSMLSVLRLIQASGLTLRAIQLPTASQTASVRKVSLALEGRDSAIQSFINRFVITDFTLQRVASSYLRLKTELLLNNSKLMRAGMASSKPAHSLLMCHVSTTDTVSKLFQQDNLRAYSIKKLHMKSHLTIDGDAIGILSHPGGSAIVKIGDRVGLENAKLIFIGRDYVTARLPSGRTTLIRRYS